VSRLSRVHGLPDAPITKPGSPYQLPDKLVKHGPRLQEFLKELHDRVLSSACRIGQVLSKMLMYRGPPAEYDAMTVGEMSGTTPEKALEYVHPANKQLNMVSTGGAEAVMILCRRDW
jgi:oligo-1,6-glucosidase